MKKLILIPLLFFVAFCIAESQIYDKHGRLLVDSTFQISKKQLKKFSVIEQPFADSLLKIIKYPPVYQENEINFDVILSFYLNDRGRLDSVKIEKINSDVVKAKYIIDWLRSTLIMSDNNFSEAFKARKSKSEKYYLPLKFVLDKDAGMTGIISGWVLKKQKKIALIDKGYTN